MSRRIRLFLSPTLYTRNSYNSYRTAARLNPFEADTYYNLSLLLRSQSAPTDTDIAEADVMMNRAILLNPDYAKNSAANSTGK
ncbi:MAG: hypothetical protein AAFZ17_17860 [Cyanobacteria bacterium J06650_10]